MANSNRSATSKGKGPRARDLVQKSLKFDRQLAGAIGAWADGAGVSFNEAVRRLCSMGLATWPGNAFSPAPAAGAVGTLQMEIRQARDDIITELRETINDAADDVLLEMV